MNPLREPVLHFALGAVIILGAERIASRRHARDAERPRIAVSAATLAGLRARFEQQTHRPATSAEDASLVEEYVRDEALAREAVARHLDDGDPVIRRRLVQKMEFVLDAQPTPEPSDGDLARWLDAHGEEFRRPPTVAFEQIFFARQRRGEATEADARSALTSMAPDEALARAIERGDPFQGGSSFPAMRFADVTQTMGYDFARALDALPIGRWQGPIESAWGWHLARVESRDPGGVPPLAAVRSEARRRWMDERRAALTREAVQRIVRRYEVVR